MIKKIISGGQTGADRAALDAAIELGIPHGGWIPKGRITEEGPLSDKDQLQEMPTDSHPARTEQTSSSVRTRKPFASSKRRSKAAKRSWNATL